MIAEKEGGKPSTHACPGATAVGKSTPGHRGGCRAALARGCSGMGIRVEITGAWGKGWQGRERWVHLQGLREVDGERGWKLLVVPLRLVNRG